MSTYRSRMISLWRALGVILLAGNVQAALDIVPGATWTAVRYERKLIHLEDGLIICRRTQASISKLTELVSCELTSYKYYPPLEG
jgi:hypothetical protein